LDPYHVTGGRVHLPSPTVFFDANVQKIKAKLSFINLVLAPRKTVKSDAAELSETSNN
jgi:hypothetical protein